ncbi:MAG: rRNA maturation RNase YbeY [Salinivirgaceae bacterium]|nr:MAG: rRNA maturation RNase YbeY [Salinivirgaceae bacterium]
MIDFTEADKPFGLYGGDFNILTNWITNTIHKEGFELGEIDIINCSDNYLLEVNREHLQHNYFTDVITFDYVVGDIISGDIYISEDRIKDNAIDFGVTGKTEFLRVIIHGVLHLCGYKDGTENEKKEMRMKEDYYLKEFNDVAEI